MAARLERQVVGEATRLVFVNRQTRDRVMAKYPAAWAARAQVVPQGFEPLPLPPPSARPAGPLRLVYTGRFYDGIRTPDTFLDALAQLNRDGALAGRLLVTFIGNGMVAYARRATTLGLAAVVHFKGRLSPQQARDGAVEADVLLAIDAPSDGPSLFLPSKLIDYLPMRKPILGVTPLAGPSADLLRQLEYPIVDPRDVAGIAAELSALVTRHADGMLAPSQQHDRIAQAYDIRETTREFERVLVEALRSA